MWKPDVTSNADASENARATMVERTMDRTFVSFDGAVKVKTTWRQPDRCRFWDSRFGDLQPSIARGAGLSYAAATFGKSSVTTDHGRFDRILSFNEETQILEVEAGATLGKLFDFLSPRGYLLNVQPGHPRITIGGCIAADVHGKNQFRDGTFCSQVVSMRLFHPSHGVLQLSRSENPDVFGLTCGAFGLTGDILSVRLRVRRIESTRARLSITWVDSIKNLPTFIEAAAQRSDLVYSWHDLTAKGSLFGAGFITEGVFLPRSEDAINQADSHAPARVLDADTRGRFMPRFFNSFSTRLFNIGYRWSVRFARPHKEVSLYNLLFPIPDKQLYFHLFGTRGFHECQLVLPTDRFVDFMGEVEEFLRTQNIPITLASAKVFAGTMEYLRFKRDGISFSFDFPHGPKSVYFAEFLDSLTMRFGALPNIIKDSRLPSRVVEAAYPQYERFRSMLRSFDPKRLYRSELSDRLHL